MATEEDYKRLGAWAAMLNPDANIDRHGHRRSVPMQVLSLGLPRTATLSIQEALELLGYPTYHYSRIFANIKDADIWQELIAAKNQEKRDYDYRKKFDEVLGEYAATTDVPSVLFWKELVEAYPDAKVILVERNEISWEKSIGLVFAGVFHPLNKYVMRFTDPYWFGRLAGLGIAWSKMLVNTKDATQATRNAIPAYRKHYADIRAAVPKEKILEYELGSGWGPLCTFLEKPIPPANVPFPHRNEAQTMENCINDVMAKAMKNSLLNVAVVVGAAAVALGVAWRFML